MGILHIHLKIYSPECRLSNSVMLVIVKLVHEQLRQRDLFQSYSLLPGASVNVTEAPPRYRSLLWDILRNIPARQGCKGLSIAEFPLGHGNIEIESVRTCSSDLLFLSTIWRSLSESQCFWILQEILNWFSIISALKRVSYLHHWFYFLWKMTECFISRNICYKQLWNVSLHDCLWMEFPVIKDVGLVLLIECLWA